MDLPRDGHEVIVSFLDGDPDQPIITGRTYHATNTPPYSLPATEEHQTFFNCPDVRDLVVGELQTLLPDIHSKLGG